MQKYLGALTFIGTITTAHVSQADELKDIVVSRLDGILRAGEHTLSHGDTKTVDIAFGNFTFSYNTRDREGCRSREVDFNSSQGSANVDFCGSVEHESYGLAYSLIDNDRVYLKPGVGISIFNDLSVSASLDITHPLISYTGEHSHIASESYYDAYISLAFGGAIPLSDSVDIYTDTEGSYGMFTHTWNSEIGLQIINDFTAVNVGVGIQDFGVHEESSTSQIVDTILGGRQDYITTGVEYCASENICFDGSVRFFEGGGKNMDISLRYEF